MKTILLIVLSHLLLGCAERRVPPPVFDIGHEIWRLVYAAIEHPLETALIGFLCGLWWLLLWNPKRTSK